MTVKYEYVLYVNGLEDPEDVAEWYAPMTADEVLASYYGLTEGGRRVAKIARREIGTDEWHDIPEAL